MEECGYFLRQGKGFVSASPDFRGLSEQGPHPTLARTVDSPQPGSTLAPSSACVHPHCPPPPHPLALVPNLTPIGWTLAAPKGKPRNSAGIITLPPDWGEGPSQVAVIPPGGTASGYEGLVLPDLPPTTSGISVGLLRKGPGDPGGTLT